MVIGQNSDHIICNRYVWLLILATFCTPQSYQHWSNYASRRLSFLAINYHILNFDLKYKHNMGNVWAATCLIFSCISCVGHRQNPYQSCWSHDCHISSVECWMLNVVSTVRSHKDQGELLLSVFWLDSCCLSLIIRLRCHNAYCT